MAETKLTRIQTPKDTFTVDYPEAIAFLDAQQKVFWPHFEVKVHKDKHDILVNMTESERYATIETLRLFTKYEFIIGDEFWLNFVMKKFPRPEIQAMAAFFGAMELGVHGQFYKKINDELNLSNDEFYNSYKEDPDLKQRIVHLQNILSDEDDLRALGNFTFAEGAILYTNFGFLKHFQSQGKNKLLNVVSGLNFSARDENLHALAAAWLFRTLLKEKREAGLIDAEYERQLEADIMKAAQVVYEHEEIIVKKKVFGKGDIDNTTPTQLLNFAKSRINLCLREMGYQNLFKVEYNPIAEWFYKGVNGFQSTDFFNSQGNQYQRDWNELGFNWTYD